MRLKEELRMKLMGLCWF